MGLSTDRSVRIPPCRPASRFAVALVAALPLMASLTAARSTDDLERQTANEAVFDHLERMATAVRTTDFEGTFVYHHGNSLAAMRIVHRYHDGESQESLLTLNGPLHTVGRSGRSVACLLSGGQSVLFDRAEHRLTDTAERHYRLPVWRQLQEHYRFQALDETRVAGRKADVVAIVPKDALRYGYRFAIDQASGLPLSVGLMATGKDPVQQLMFTDLTLLAGPGGAAVQSDSDRPDRAGRTPPTGLESRWRFNGLPDGFVLLEHDWIRDPERGPETDQDRVEYFLFGDGLASISLFIASADQSGLTGPMRMAAIHAAGKSVDGYQMTAVGEVPAATVAALINAVAPVSGSATDSGPSQSAGPLPVRQANAGEMHHD